jgi:hypothetical protein
MGMTPLMGTILMLSARVIDLTASVARSQDFLRSLAPLVPGTAIAAPPSGPRRGHRGVCGDHDQPQQHRNAASPHVVAARTIPSNSSRSRRCSRDSLDGIPLGADAPLA